MQTAQVIPLTGEVQNPTVGARRVDASRGGHSGVLSRQWAVRPDDQRFLTLDALYNAVSARTDRSFEIDSEPRRIEVKATVEDANTLTLVDRDDGRELVPTHYAFGQMATKMGAPTSWLRQIPAPLVAMNLQYALARYPEGLVRLFATDTGSGSGLAELRATTSTNYGRIHDRDIVASVRRIAGEGSGWKVPGVMDWGTGIYNPNADISARTTTLYASDRDVFVFLCRDTHPIEVGKLPNGDPDYLFPGFIVSNSEVGAGALKIETMFLRAVCCNRNLWGVEDSGSVRIRHTRLAPERFAEQAEPALLAFVNEASRPVIDMVRAAKAFKVAANTDEAVEFLQKADLSKKLAAEVVTKALEQEGHEPRSMWDFVQAVSAAARDIPHQDNRIALERVAGSWMKKVA